MPFQACTIIARNYLAQARVLHDSFRSFHPDATFSVLIIDAGSESYDEGFEIIPLRDIGLPDGEKERMPLLYNVTELATALKPWFFRHLITKRRTELIYFDPDMEIFAPLDAIAQLAAQHSIVLTPHTTKPINGSSQHPNETDILGSGIYNLGFLALNKECTPFLDWWGERLRREAIIDVANMRFTDQRWMDFTPGYFDTFILKDETCNVAYWNADRRRVQWTGERYEVNGNSLSFFHFSGFSPETPHLLSKHQGNNPRTRFSDQPTLRRLCEEYAAKLYARGYSETSNCAYGFDSLPNGFEVTPAMRLTYRQAMLEHELGDAPMPPNPYSGDLPRFIQWLNEPPRETSCRLSRYLRAIHQSRGDLQALFPDPKNGDQHAYYAWLLNQGRREVPIPPELLRQTPDFQDHQPTTNIVPGITVTGYFRAEVGTGETGRLMLAAVEASGEAFSTYLYTRSRSRQNHPWSEAGRNATSSFDTNVLCINADQIPEFYRRTGPQFFKDRYNIGLWFWELETWPDSLREAFDYIDEVWVASDFIREAISTVSTKPVFVMPFPLLPAVADDFTDCSSLKLPKNFLFLFSFDFLSVFERKNPLAVIEAFMQAFAPGEGPQLMIKSINGDKYPAHVEKLHYAVHERSDIHLRDGYLTAVEKASLMASCACYVSLHRSEGLGLTMAEAMLLAKPVIATRYSGNLAFMNDANSFLCGYDMQRVGPFQEPYSASAHWANPRVNEAAKLMRFVFTHREEAARRGAQAQRDLLQAHDAKKAGAFIRERLAALRRHPPSALPRPAPPSSVFAKAQAAVHQGVDVRSMVPTLFTWIFRGPRKAMKRLLKDYDQHQRILSQINLNAFSGMHAEWRREQTILAEQLVEREVQVERLEEKLEGLRREVTALTRKLDKMISSEEPGQP